MEIGKQILVAASRKRRQWSRFLGRRLIQSDMAFYPAVWGNSIGNAVVICVRAPV